MPTQRHVLKPETAKRNHRNKRNETKRNETNGKHRNETKPLKQSETTEKSTQNTVKYEEKKLAIYGAKTVARETATLNHVHITD